MDSSLLIEEIKRKDVDVEYFANKIIENESCRKEVVENLLTNKEIMVYYHCYYIVSMASELRADLFYEYWHDFAALLDHKNSYHRDIGLTIIANLVKVDNNNYFEDIFYDYLRHFDDAKFMTAQCFLKNLAKIAKIRVDLREKIVETLIEVDKRTSYPVKQRELLKYSILQIFDIVYNESNSKEKIDFFIQSSLNSRSPKTKKKAKELVKKYFI
ncbi:hypothetical protein [Wukongibacter sp. M2B1]|uniref:hypothetical protein n=1 Tax=Wukongibacter sp. M2B1 TaxID=3088895 RepID=UPI003D7B5907